ncbi:MAG: histidine phosphotransferase family protein [Rhodospirillaceae bacterium]|nr:histidine phosphotransferase family protein [Rhodospirillaceae bacterium]
MQDPLTLTQVLCTRLCHDLAGPIGAVAAGVELLGGDPAQADAETLALIGNSSAAAARKLKFLRMALGTPGGSAQALADLRAALEGYVQAIASTAGAASLTWPEPSALAALDSVGLGRAAQILANIALVALETVPRTRRLEVNVAPATKGCELSVTAHGQVSAQSDARGDLAALLQNHATAAITPKTVQALYLCHLLAPLGGSARATPTPEGCRVSVVLPSAGGP